jgi:alkylation response protein AidB-like acyl-CoA dehydrogenase
MYLLSEEDQEIIDAVQKFSSAQIPQYESFKERHELPLDLFYGFGELGVTALAVSEQYGGLKKSNLLISKVLETIASVDLGPAVFLSVHLMVTKILENFSQEETKKNILPKLCEGKLLGAFALTEPQAGSDASSLRTEAVETKDGYILNGEKCYITSAGFADVYIVFARTPKTSGKDGISAFIVSKETPGLLISSPEKKMGCELSPIASLTFSNCLIPKSSLLGTLGNGYRIALSGLAAGRISIGACANGISKTAISLAANFIKERKQFGKALAEFQGLQFMLADMRMQYEAAKLLVEYAAIALDNGLHSNEPNLYPSMAKCTATDNAMKISTDAVQLFGGAGYIKEYKVEGLMRDAKMLQIVEGANQVQRVLIAKATLGN